MNKTEELLIKNKYWIWSKGSIADEPLLIAQPKWRRMIEKLYDKNPSDMIKESDILEYINKNE